MIEVEFTRNYAPHKKGEVKELSNKIAEFYLSIDAAFRLTHKKKVSLDGLPILEKVKKKVKAIKKVK
jgi:hypothetical protein